MGSRVLAGCFAAFLVLRLATLEPAAISNDGPQHLWAAFVEAHDVGGYTLHAPPTSNGAHQLLLGLLGLGLEPLRALAVAGVIVAALFAGGFASLCLACDRRRWPLALFGLGAGDQFAALAGTLPFLLALAAGMGVLAWTLVAPSARTSTKLATSAGLLFTAWLHIVPAAIFGVVVTIVAVARGPTRIRVLLESVLMGGPALAVVAMTIGQPTSSVEVHSVLLAPTLNGLAGAFLPQAPVAEAVLFFVAIVGVAMTVVLRPSASTVAVGVVAVGLVLLGIAVSPDAIGWELMRERVFGVGVLLAVPLVPIERVTARTSTLLAALALAWSVHVYEATARLNEAIARVMAPVVEASAHLPPMTGRWMTVLTQLPPGDEPRRGRLAAWLHVGQAMAVHLGGLPAYSQDDAPAFHHILRAGADEAGRTTAPSPVRWPKLWRATPQQRPALVSAYAAWGATISGLVVVGPADEMALFTKRGHRVVASTPVAATGLVAYSTSFVGCSVPASLRAVVEYDDVVEVGFFPASEPLAAFPVASGRDVVHLHGIPCGADLWFRLRLAGCAEQPGSARVAMPAVGVDPLVLPCTPAKKR